MEAARYVPVACMVCGRPFQAQQEQLGLNIVCPWCQSLTPALPIATASPAASAQPGASVAASSPSPPSSLEQAASMRESAASGTESASPTASSSGSPLLSGTSSGPIAAIADRSAPRDSLETPPLPGRSVGWRRWQATLTLVGVFLIASFTLIALRFRQGYGISAEWRPFVSPDGQVQIDLLGSPWEEPDSQGGRRFWSRGWYSGAYAWIGWQDLTEQQAQAARSPDARHKLDGLIQAELERWQRHFGGSGHTATLQFSEPLIVEIRWDAGTCRGQGRVVVTSQGSNPRVYYLGIAAPHLVFDSVAVRHFLDSFRYASTP